MLILEGFFMKRIITTLVLVSVLFSLAAVPANDLLQAVVPFEYGFERFEQRIAEASEGREPLGLLLSGGSARAFAHIGVIRAFEELGVRPDYIISNSMGSIVGILYAAGLNSSQIYEIVKNVDPGTLLNMTYPFNGGLLDPSAFVEFFTSYVEDTPNLEDLEIPIIVITEDAKTKRQVLLAEGDIGTVLAAAFALPVYFPPVEFSSHLLMDGGTTNLVPVEIATRFSDRVIVSTTFYEGKGINLKSALGLLNISMDTSKRRLGVQSLLEHPQAVWIRCDVEDFSFMDFDKVDELSENGYESAYRVKEEILEVVSATGGPRSASADTGFAAVHKQILDDYNYYFLPDVSGVSNQVFTGGINFPEGESFRSYLRDDILSGLRYTFRAPSTQLSALAGVAWQPYTMGDVYPEVMVQAHYLALPSLKIAGVYVASNDSFDSFSPDQYVAAELTLRQLSLSRSLRIEQRLAIEGLLSSSFSFSELLAQGGIGITYTKEWEYSAGLSFQLWDEFTRQFLNGEVSVTAPITPDITLRTSATLRYAFDQGGDVPFFVRDGYYTSSSALLQQGRGGAANGSDLLGVLSVEADWNPHAFRPTVGELVIFKHSSIGAFSQLLWNESGEYIPDVSAGVHLKTSLGFIGLKELPLRVFAGYDTLSADIFGGFSILGGL